LARPGKSRGTELGCKRSSWIPSSLKKNLLAQSLTVLASRRRSTWSFAHGGQNNEACAEVASKFPECGSLWSFKAVLRRPTRPAMKCCKKSRLIWAATSAALTTRPGVAAHMSSHSCAAGFEGTCCFVAGVKATNPDVKVLTNFFGNQDDNALSKRVALAEIANGADCIFTMLNAGRLGAIEACREKGVRQIGNVVDWVKPIRKCLWLRPLPTSAWPSFKPFAI
jgi:basic membrane protein A